MYASSQSSCMCLNNILLNGKTILIEKITLTFVFFFKVRCLKLRQPFIFNTCKTYAKTVFFLLHEFLFSLYIL